MASSNKILIFFLIFLTAVVMLPLGITSTVLGVKQPGSCDYEDSMGLDVGQYLLGMGIASIITCCLLSFSYILLLTDAAEMIGAVFIMVITILNVLFGFAWFIIGAVILFRSNIDCINNGSSHVIYALVLWCISAFLMLKDCCSVKSKNREDV